MSVKLIRTGTPGTTLEEGRWAQDRLVSGHITMGRWLRPMSRSLPWAKVGGVPANVREVFAADDGVVLSDG